MFNITYSQVFYVNKSSHGVQHKYFLVFCVNKSSQCSATKYWGILYVGWALWEDYLHKILGITLCWTLWEDLFTQNTEEYSMLNTEEIYLHKILRNTLCWTHILCK
jgi:hypothetical protein